MVKTVSIKDGKEKDIINYLSSNGYLDNFSYYIKGLIREDMERCNQPSSRENRRKVKFQV